MSPRGLTEGSDNPDTLDSAPSFDLFTAKTAAG